MRIVPVFLGLVMVVLAADRGNAESIRSALASAYSSNPTLNAQRAATRANDENLSQAKSGFRPTVFATVDGSRSYSRSDLSGTSNTTPWGYGITIQQNLFNGFRTVNNIRAAEAGILASRETLRNVEQNILLGAAQAYVGVIQAADLLNIRQRNISFLREQLRSSKARLEVGEGTRTDLAQSQAQLELARAQLSAATASLAAAKATYRQIIGRAPSGTHWPRVPRSILPSGLNQAISVASTSHPSVRATAHFVDAALFNVKVAEGAFLPTVDAQVSANRRFNSGVQANTVESAEAGISVRVPLYQAGAPSSVVRQNKQLLAQRRIQVDEARDTVRQEVVAAYTLLQSARANLNANSAQVKAARLALSGVVEERNVGQRTQLDVLLAQNSVLQAQELQVQSRASEIIAAYRLAAATGRLNSQRLGLQVAHYKPKAHYEAVKDKWFGLRTPSGQ